MVETGTTESVDEGTLGIAYRVTDEQVAHLRERGWAYVPGLLDSTVVAEVRSHLIGHPEVTRLAGFGSEAPDSGAYETKTALTRREGLCWSTPFMRAVATSRRFGSLVTGLMQEPTALLAADMGFNKAAEGGDTKLHQDYPYYPWDRAHGLTIWIALVDMTEDMGPIHYLEGSHREGPLGFANPAVELLDRYPELKKYPVGFTPTMAAGDANVHLDLLVHGSAPNNTDRDREAWAVRYMRADTVYNGIRHAHYDRFDIVAGTRFADTGYFPLVGPDGPAA